MKKQRDLNAIDVGNTIDRINRGEIKERSVFHNKEGLIPDKGANYYHEFVLPTPGIQGVGPQRIIRGGNGELYYSPDHYKSFLPLN